MYLLIFPHIYLAVNLSLFYKIYTFALLNPNSVKMCAHC